MGGAGNSVGSDTTTSIILLLLFYLGNVMLNVYNKWLFQSQKLKLPLLMTMFHMCVCQVGALVILYLAPHIGLQWKPKNLSEVRYGWQKMVLISLFFALNTGFNNSALVYLNLAANQIIRACLPAMTAIVSIFTEGKVLETKTYICLACVVGGVILSLLKNPEFSMIGCILSFSGTASGAFHVTVVGSLVGSDMRLSAFDVLLYTSLPMGMFVLIPALATSEFSGAATWIGEHGAGKFFILMFGGGLLALAYNIIHYLFIKYTSAVYTTVAGNFKVVIVIVASIIIFNTQFVWINVVGIIITMAAFTVYSIMEFQRKQKEKAAASNGTRTEYSRLKPQDKADGYGGVKTPA